MLLLLRGGPLWLSRIHLGIYTPPVAMLVLLVYHRGYLGWQVVCLVIEGFLCQGKTFVVGVCYNVPQPLFVW